VQSDLLELRNGLTTDDIYRFLHRGQRHQVAVDQQELVELRASQRTFNGAYNRTALGMLGYGITIFRLFDKRFYQSEF
jgi:uncharacterized membrane protein YidH (DUF202 family)